MVGVIEAPDPLAGGEDNDYDEQARDADDVEHHPQYRLYHILADY